MIKRLFIVVLISVFLSSCNIADKLGFDTYDYMGELVLTTHAADSEIALSLEEVLDILISDTLNLNTFDNMSEAIKEYRDEVLNYILETEYAKYSGNLDMIQKAETAYPEYDITQIIPADDFEAVMYRYFSGNVKITHGDSERFLYLPRVESYIPAINPNPSSKFSKISSLTETQKTYRVVFNVYDNEGNMSEEYFALIIKRDDGTQYIKKLILNIEV